MEIQMLKSSQRKFKFFFQKFVGGFFHKQQIYELELIQVSCSCYP